MKKVDQGFLQSAQWLVAREKHFGLLRKNLK
jgi:hypothetical protein